MAGQGARRQWAAAWPAIAALVAGGVLLRLADPGRVAWLQALPFVLLGAVVSAAIEVFVPAGTFDRLARLPKPMQLPVAALGGVAFPVCECGSVPVARRLVVKGVSPQAAVTFMLASPILNPVVIAATVFAYRGRESMWTMVLGRAGLGMIVAIAVGWVVGTRSRDELLRLRASPEAQGHEHEETAPAEGRWTRFAGHVGGDFLFMGKFLVLGAIAAAAVQTFVPQSIVGGVATAPVVGIAAMMGLAFLLSLCSESDAFVAASFVQFGPASQLAFLVFGPMVDMKLVALYMGIFSRGFTRMVVIVAAATTLVGCLWIQVIWG
jgi:uncharacterized protein